MNLFKHITIIIFFGLGSLAAKNPDLTIVGVLRFNGGMTRLPIGLIDCFKDELAINFISTEPWKEIDFSDVSDDVKKVASDQNKTPGNVALLVEHPWFTWMTPSSFMPDSPIKIAISMIESTKIPTQWVTILNSQFDAVVVPDPYLVDVYSSCGVTIPIFILPLGIMLDDFIARTPCEKPHSPFTFGISGCLCPTKNQGLLIDAFAQEFNNSPDVRLKIHANNGFYDIYKQQIDRLQTTNIDLTFESLNHPQFLDFMRSLDCYVLLSKGEGYSNTPREALAMGIPCILTNNTAQTSICKSGFVKVVESPLLEDADYKHIFGATLGHKFNCTFDDARKALRDVYENYSFFKQKALQGREWVKQYNYSQLKAYYRSLIKPKKVVLGSSNTILSDCLTTNSQALYDKYRTIID